MAVIDEAVSMVRCTSRICAFKACRDSVTVVFRNFSTSDSCIFSRLWATWERTSLICSVLSVFVVGDSRNMCNYFC